MTTALLLGAAVWPGGPSPALRRRTQHAAELYLAGDVARIIACGGVGEHPPSEAVAMAALLRNHGVPDAAVRIEDASTTTEQNIVNALALLGDPTAPIVIISDFYHLPRACLIGRRLGLDVTRSAPRLAVKTWATTRQILREVPGYLWYAVTFWPKR